MKIGWVMGWATPRSWFAPLVETAFPEDRHVYFAASSELWESLEKCAHFDCLVGYSLGSLLLLQNPERAERLAAQIVLLAPIFAFPKEAALGGKIARSQILYLAKWLRRDPTVALADFSARAGLNLPSQGVNQVDLIRLEWGLKRLEADQVQPPAPRGWELYCGSGDTLLDHEALKKLDSATRMVGGATHHLGQLLKAWASTRRRPVEVSR